MSKVQQAEGIANNHSHEPQRSENCWKENILPTKVSFKLLVLEVGVKAQQRLSEAEAMSKIVGSFTTLSKGFLFSNCVNCPPRQRQKTAS